MVLPEIEPPIRGVPVEPVLPPQDQIGQNALAAIPPQRMLQTPEMPVVPERDSYNGELPEAAPDRTGIQRYWPTMRAAQGEADQRALVEPGEQYRAYERIRDERPVAKKGWGGRILAALKGIGYSGNLAGGIVGAVSPQTIRDYEHRNMDIPQALERAEVEQREQARQLGAGGRMADLTGMNPWTGEPTETARYRQAQEAETQTRNRMVNEDRDLARQDRVQAAKERAAATAVQRAALMKQPVPVDAVKGTSLEALGGVVPPEKSTTPHWVQDVNGTWVDVNAVKGPVQGRVPRDPNEMTPYQIQSDKRAQDREDRAERTEQRKAVSEAGVTLNRAQGAINAARNVRRIGDESDESFAARRDQLWATALAEVQQAVEAHPDLLEGGEGQGGFPYIKKKAAASRGGSQKDPRVGKTYSGKDGKRYRVTGIDRDGDPIAVEVP